MSKKTKRAKEWPPIYKVTHRSGQVSYQVDLGIVDGQRKRVNFPNKPEAKTYGEQCRIARANEGKAAFTLIDISADVRAAIEELRRGNERTIMWPVHRE